MTSDVRVATWCCDGVASQTDSLDVLLFNEGQPIDILLLQSTQGPCPIMGILMCEIAINMNLKYLDGYQFVESIAPEYDQTSGVAIYWRDLVSYSSTLFDCM